MTDEIAEKLRVFLQPRLDPDEMATAEAIMRGTTVAGDEPPPFPGRPRPGGGQDPITAQDGAGRSFSSRLTDRIRTL